MHVARKQRVETYLTHDTVETLENNYDESVSAVIRTAVNDYINEDTTHE